MHTAIGNIFSCVCKYAQFAVFRVCTRMDMVFAMQTSLHASVDCELYRGSSVCIQYKIKQIINWRASEYTTHS